MKKIAVLVVLLIIFVCPIGCSHQEKKEDAALKKTEVESELDSSMDTKESVPDVDENQNNTTEQNQSNTVEQEIVDLTDFSKTMAFAEMSNIYMTPKDYIGKTLKVKGVFGYFQAYDNFSQPIPDKYHFMVVIADEMGCCGVAMEFIPGEEYVFPEDFPNEEDPIIVSGVIKKEKNEYGQEDVRLTEAKIETNE